MRLKMTDGEVDYREFKDMIDAIENDRQPMVNVYEGKKPVEIILAGYKASKERKQIKIGG